MKTSINKYGYSFTIVKDKFNSDIFQKKMYNVVFNQYGTKEKVLDIITIIIDYCKNNKISHLSVKVSPNISHLVIALNKSGFYIVDTLVTYLFDNKKSALPTFKIKYDFKEKISESDITKLAKIAKDVFQIDRYHSDDSLDNNLTNNYYRNWVINSFNGFADGAIVPCIDNNVVGFTTYTVNDNDDFASMVLSAVDSKHMGKGIYFDMIYEGTKRLLKLKDKVKVGTQVNNIAVQRTWQKLGYRIIDVDYVMHMSITDEKTI